MLFYLSPTDPKNIACWLEENKLTLNTSKSKFMLIVNSKKLKNVSHFKLTINTCTLETECTLKYLGIVINENISWADHIDFATKKVKSTIWRSAKDFTALPIYARNLFVSVTVLPFFDYCDIFYGDKNDKVLIDSLQVLHNKAAKIVLNRPVHSSSAQTLIDLRWINPRVGRRIQRLVDIFKCLNRLLDQNYDHFHTGS